jgi:hypothetical protein
MSELSPNPDTTPGDWLGIERLEWLAPRQNRQVRDSTL